MKKGGNANHPKKGSRIAVDPICQIKDIKAISKMTSGNPRDHLLFAYNTLANSVTDGFTK